VSSSFLSDCERPPSHKKMTVAFPQIRLCLDISLEAKTVFFTSMDQDGPHGLLLVVENSSTYMPIMYIHTYVTDNTLNLKISDKLL
jgi:hypothetical protein